MGPDEHVPDPAAVESQWGHRILPHTADLIIEAWAPSLGGCLGEAVVALVEAFADTSELPVSRTIPVSFGRASPEDLLVEVLEEVIYALDVLSVVPVAASFEEAEDGGISGMFDVVPADTVEVVGAIPKAVSLSGLTMTYDEKWRATATVDV